MSGGAKTKSQKTFSNQTKGNEQSMIDDTGTLSERSDDVGEAKLTLEGEQAKAPIGLETISRQINDLRTEMKTELRSFTEFKNSMKQEFAQF